MDTGAIPTETTDTEYFDRAVAEGAALLDNLNIVDWRLEIDLETLEMDSRVDCVAGQIFGDFGRAPFDIKVHRAFYLYADTILPDGVPRGHRYYMELEAAWKRYLTAA